MSQTVQPKRLKCPGCEAELTKVFYTELRIRMFDVQLERWVDPHIGGDGEFSCPECGYEFEYEELVDAGVI